MRLLRNLVKAATVLAVAAGALGGAAALGSTLFEEPPRDAAAFAKRLRAAGEPASERTKPERRYARALTALCLRRAAKEKRLAELPAPADLPDWFGKAKPVLVRHRAEVAAIRPPRSYRPEVRELLAAQQRSVAVLERLVARLAAGDRTAVDELLPVKERLDRRADDLFALLGGRACVGA